LYYNRYKVLHALGLSLACGPKLQQVSFKYTILSEDLNCWVNKLWVCVMVFTQCALWVNDELTERK